MGDEERNWCSAGDCFAMKQGVADNKREQEELRADLREISRDIKDAVKAINQQTAISVEQTVKLTSLTNSFEKYEGHNAKAHEKLFDGLYSESNKRTDDKLELSKDIGKKTTTGDVFKYMAGFITAWYFIGYLAKQVGLL